MARKALQVIEVSRSQFVDIATKFLSDYKGFVTLVARTSQNGSLIKPVANFGKDVLIEKVEKTTVNFGRDYQGEMRKLLDNPDFVAQKPFGKHHISPNFMAKDTDENVKYMCVYKVKGNGMMRSWDRRYMVNGVLADADMTAKIKSLYRPYTANALEMRTYGVENLIAVRMGGIHYVLR